jgi:hypothetical protein
VIRFLLRFGADAKPYSTGFHGYVQRRHAIACFLQELISLERRLRQGSARRRLTGENQSNKVAIQLTVFDGCRFVPF